MTARVLVVDDEALVALNLRDVLVCSDYKVVGPAYRLESAIALARDEPLDAAVLDIDLAGSAVWPVARILTERHIAFVLLSGYGSAFQVPHEYCEVPRLMKPFEDTLLLATLDGMVGQGTCAGMQP